MIERIFPPTPGDAGPASDEDLLGWYGSGLPTDPGAPWVSFNFVSSIDGAAALDGRSGKLGNADDQRVFQLLRRHADVILVGAATVRAEGYGGHLLSVEAQQWRTNRGLTAHPPLAIVSGTLNLDPAHEVFTQAPVRPLVLTLESAPSVRREALSAVADVVLVGQESLNVEVLIQELAARDLLRIHSEGGPTLLGTFQAADRVDELCLTVSPLLVGGAGPRIAGAPSVAGQEDTHPTPAHTMSLAHILTADSMLFLRYFRNRSPLNPHA
ncbi:pyrimidine reductase family protein [Arthrobacter sp. GMC3]|uniref:pyrimidine reductase family protein n=1 Tax=Arthrobacter sp. GMC3 TaxID=2058894 RepID=UPI000CE564CD|nr:pyrimidine reductase family protein [Arthrobacter sp. GMC3]